MSRVRMTNAHSKDIAESAHYGVEQATVDTVEALGERMERRSTDRTLTDLGSQRGRCKSHSLALYPLQGRKR